MTNRADIEKVLWDGANTFRGKIGAANYKDYILPILFVKYLSDKYEELIEDVRKEYKDSARFERIKNTLPIKLNKECTFDYLYDNRNSPEIGVLINKALKEIENNNQTQLRNIFGNIDFNNEAALGNQKQKQAILINLLEGFKKLDLRPSHIETTKGQVPSDVLGDAFEYMIGEFASQAGKKAGSFFTPMMVSELMARIVKPQKKESIYDPTAGSGSLLIRSAKQAGIKDCSIFAQESDGSSYAMCRMNMFIHEIEHAEVAWGDSIADPKHLDYDGNLMKFDNIVANMPFSLDKWADGFNQGIENFKMTPDLDPYHRFEYGIPPSSKGDWAFLLHMIASLKENGKMVAVIPHGVLFRGASEGKIRQKVVEQNLIDAIIGLPENLFFGTSIPAALLVIKKNRNNKDILFIDASKDYISDKAQNKLTQESINKIINTYENRKEIEKYSHLATFDEIKENDFNLNITRYIDTFEEEEEIDIDTLRNDIENTKKELNKVENELEEYLKDVLTQK